MCSGKQTFLRNGDKIYETICGDGVGDEAI